MSSQDIDKAAAALHDPRTGWVNRRDAAEALGNAAMHAIKTLRAHEEDPDTDVRETTRKLLREVAGVLAGIEPRPPETAPQSFSLEQLARACEKEGERTVTPRDGGFVVTVRLRQGRHQDILVSALERNDGVRLIRVFTDCGEASDDALSWALRANVKLTHCALALTSEGDAQRFVLTRCFLADAAGPAQVKAAVKEMAFYGDWMEKKLSGLDEL